MSGAMIYDFFIAHAGSDLAQARILRDLLDEAGFAVFLDSVDLRLGDNWDTELPRAQAASRTTIVLISQNIDQAWYQREEVNAAIDLARRESHRVVPIYLAQGIEVPYGLRRLHGATACDDEALRDTARRLATEARRGAGVPGQDEDPSVSTRPSERSPDRGIVMVDASHRQEEWGRPSGAFVRAAERLAGSTGRSLRMDVASTLSSMAEPRGSCLILALPFHTEMERQTVDAIARWVGAGGGLLYLGYYLAAIHHGTDPNELAFLLGFEFGPDLLMPPSEHTRSDYQDQAFHDRPDYVVPVAVPQRTAHQLIGGVEELALVSACSLRNIQSDTDLILTSSPASVVEVTGPKTREGYILQIKDYLATGVETPAVVAAWHHGDGRVVACGSWKVLTRGTADNTRFMANAIDWLTGD